MNLTFTRFWILFLFAPNQAGEPQVIIRNATPAAVVEILKTELVPQGFKFLSADEKSSLFILDRGVVVQERGRGTTHVILELRFWFKPRPEGLEVRSGEEVTDALYRTARKTVRSPAELNNLQRLLDQIRSDLEARPARPDSGAKGDSSHGSSPGVRPNQRLKLAARVD